MSIPASVKYIRLSGAMVAKPVSVRTAGATWKLIQTVPGAPTGVSATAGNTTASVSWTAPASTGGIVLTGYTVTSTPGSITASTNGTTTSTTVSGLTNGTSYTFTVVATNAVGNSVASAASSGVTPAGSGNSQPASVIISTNTPSSGA